MHGQVGGERSLLASGEGMLGRGDHRADHSTPTSGVPRTFCSSSRSRHRRTLRGHAGAPGVRINTDHATTKARGMKLAVRTHGDVVLELVSVFQTPWR